MGSVQSPVWVRSGSYGFYALVFTICLGILSCFVWTVEWQFSISSIIQLNRVAQVVIVLAKDISKVFNVLLYEKDRPYSFRKGMALITH